MARHWQVVAGMLLGLLGPAVWAESTPSNADEEAMARARRQAENPMRRILEAGRITVRRRVVVEAVEAAASAPTEPATLATRSAAPAPESARAGGEIQPPSSVAASAVRVTVEPPAPEASQAAVNERAVKTPSLALAAPALSGPVAAGGAAATGRDQPTSMPREGGQDREASLRLPSPASKPTPQVPVFKTLEWAPDQPPDGERPANPQPSTAPRRPPCRCLGQNPQRLRNCAVLSSRR